VQDRYWYYRSQNKSVLLYLSEYVCYMQFSALVCARVMPHAFDWTSALYAFVGTRVCCIFATVIYCAACIRLNICVVMCACHDTGVLLALAWCYVCCQNVCMCSYVQVLRDTVHEFG
jgi:hypothetical protein